MIGLNVDIDESTETLIPNVLKTVFACRIQKTRCEESSIQSGGGTSFIVLTSLANDIVITRKEVFRKQIDGCRIHSL